MSADITYSFTVPQSPQQVYDAVVDVRGWWGDVVGDTTTVGSEWVYFVPDIHFTQFRTTELVPGALVEWRCVDSYLSFVADHHEWTGTTVRFEISPLVGPEQGTRLVFTHVGLTPEVECHDVCHIAWGQYVLGSLRDHAAAGTGRPMAFSNQASLDAALASSVAQPEVP